MNSKTFYTFTKRYALRYGVVVVAAATVLAVVACSSGSDDEEPVAESQPAAPTELTIQLTSAAFAEGADIPEKYTCDGGDVSPALAWSGVPQGTQSIALIADDPDAPHGTWVHWVLFGVPGNVNELPEGLPPGIGRTKAHSWIGTT
ncbi:MAG: YbhB/YbcL family Raf kinase inhibitor-like protein [Gemmatimonadetes bacterium]|nr:YbhB/YbcL family Raf kinase inhibitor-like protein [Gemmatimonadota bacterium]